jgi:hypothetical protein
MTLLVEKDKLFDVVTIDLFGPDTEVFEARDG